ncbi:hypothetical protein BD779DRAFT_231069 [Infundibulicybe gibba]|nr:hypothetical protein BD779DRAFT_231069 [Infundibulicybe gibba]
MMNTRGTCTRVSKIAIRSNKLLVSDTKCSLTLVKTNTAIHSVMSQDHRISTLKPTIIAVGRGRGSGRSSGRAVLETIDSSPILARTQVLSSSDYVTAGARLPIRLEIPLPYSAVSHAYQLLSLYSCALEHLPQEFQSALIASARRTNARC